MKYHNILLILISLPALLLTGCHRYLPATTDELAHQAHRALESRDLNALMELASPGEVARSGMVPKSTGIFLDILLKRHPEGLTLGHRRQITSAHVEYDLTPRTPIKAESLKKERGSYFGPSTRLILIHQNGRWHLAFTASLMDWMRRMHPLATHEHNYQMFRQTGIHQYLDPKAGWISVGSIKPATF